MILQGKWVRLQDSALVNVQFGKMMVYKGGGFERKEYEIQDVNGRPVIDKWILSDTSRQDRVTWENTVDGREVIWTREDPSRYKVGTTLGVYDIRDRGWHLGTVISAKNGFRLVRWKARGEAWFAIASQRLRDWKACRNYTGAGPRQTTTTQNKEDIVSRTLGRAAGLTPEPVDDYEDIVQLPRVQPKRQEEVVPDIGYQGTSIDCV